MSIWKYYKYVFFLVYKFIERNNSLNKQHHKISAPEETVVVILSLSMLFWICTLNILLSKFSISSKFTPLESPWIYLIVLLIYVFNYSLFSYKKKFKKVIAEFSKTSSSKNLIFLIIPIFGGPILLFILILIRAMIT